MALSDEQIATLRDEVAAGKSPRVRISGSQFGAAAAGSVRTVGDPTVDGNDYMTVRVKVNGVTDDLRFAPRELSRGKEVPVKRPSRRAAAPARRSATSSASPAAADVPASAPRRPAVTTPARTPRRPVVSAAAPRRGGRKATPGASVTITLKSAGTSWTVSAQRGAKSVAKNVTVNPGVVSAVAGLLEVSSLEDAVAAVNDTARVEAELRAEELRAELARIQAVLDSHRRP